MRASEVGQLCFDDVSPDTEGRADAARSDRASELREPQRMPARRVDEVARGQPRGDVLIDRFEEAISRFTLAVVLDKQAGVDQLFEGVDHADVPWALARDRFGRFETEPTDHHRQSGQHLPGRRGELLERPGDEPIEITMPFLEQACSIGEKFRPAFPARQQLARGQRATPRRGEFQCQREPVEATAELLECMLIVCRIEGRAGHGHAVGKQLDRRVPVEWGKGHP